jgi:hypothetical protein
MAVAKAFSKRVSASSGLTVQWFVRTVLTPLSEKSTASCFGYSDGMKCLDVMTVRSTSVL